ncbi:hypothetical protein FACS189414_4210 [Bacteroidia bacterium]|nr:hypothetical protein AGMMS49574_25300 [Bacteroidia bacterium]GHU77237.1 hypothetical protein FACS189414_4210 [Bacteroidia bacterium]
MELEELKAGWSILSERLNQNEILNKRIIKEMITKRTQTAYDRLLGFNVRGLILCLTAIPGVLLINMFPLFHKSLSVVITAEVVIILASIWAAIKIKYLYQFQLDRKTVPQLSLWALKYKKLIKYEEIFTYITLVIVITIMYFLIRFSTMMILFCALVVIFASILSYILYCYIEKKNITTIEQGLEELKELEKEA